MECTLRRALGRSHVNECPRSGQHPTEDEWARAFKGDGSFTCDCGLLIALENTTGWERLRAVIEGHDALSPTYSPHNGQPTCQDCEQRVTDTAYIGYDGILRCGDCALKRTFPTEGKPRVLVRWTYDVPAMRASAVLHELLDDLEAGRFYVEDLPPALVARFRSALGVVPSPRV